MKMKQRVLCFVVLFLHVLSLVCASTRPLTANDANAVSNQDGAKSNQTLKIEILEGNNYKRKSGEMEEGDKMGSKPPSCEHKCYGCAPCEPIQVPNSKNTLQYTNYLPEGWKCKCGHTFYSP